MKKLITFALCFLCLYGCQKNNKHSKIQTSKHEHYKYYSGDTNVTASNSSLSASATYRSKLNSSVNNNPITNKI